MAITNFFLSNKDMNLVQQSVPTNVGFKYFIRIINMVD